MSSLDILTKFFQSKQKIDKYTKNRIDKENREEVNVLSKTGKRRCWTEIGRTRKKEHDPKKSTQRNMNMKKIWWLKYFSELFEAD